MKFLAVILSICLLGFSYPSFADTDCHSHTEQETSGTKHQHEHNDEDCSTSCPGFCCSTSIIFENLSYSLILNQIIEVQDCPVYHNFYGKKLSYTIWQPPKIA